MAQQAIKPQPLKPTRYRLSRREWIIVAAAVGCLFIFAAFLIASFPYNDTVGRLLAPYQLKLVYDEQHMSLPIGVRFDHVSLYDETQTPHRLLLQSPTIRLAPVIMSLLWAQPQLQLDADVYGGSLRLRMRQEAALIHAEFAADGLSLAASQPLRQFGIALAGSVSGDGSAGVSNGALNEDQGAMRIGGANVTVELANGFPTITLGSVNGHLELADGVVTFDDLEVHGGDVEARLKGTIRLAPVIAESTIAAHLNLTPTPSGRDHFGLFFNLLPHPPSEGPYYVSGPLLSPRIS